MWQQCVETAADWAPDIFFFIIYLLLLLFTAIGFSPGGSSLTLVQTKQ
jgi:hypothetical protein